MKGTSATAQASTVESTKSTELDQLKQAETPQKSTELTNNTSKDTEDTNETAEQKAEEPKGEPKTGKTAGVVVVTYIGSGVWQDENGELWAPNARDLESGSILSERQYSAKEFEKREDIKFMIAYGSMKSTVVEK